MSVDPLSEMNDRLIASSSVLADFRADPVVCLESHGVTLTDQQKANLRASDVHTLDPPQLRDRLKVKSLAAHL